MAVTCILGANKSHVSPGIDVVYSYRVRNTEIFPITIFQIEDDVLGIIPVDTTVVPAGDTVIVGTTSREADCTTIINKFRVEWEEAH